MKRLILLKSFVLVGFCLAGHVQDSPGQEKPNRPAQKGLRPGEVNTPPAKSERHKDTLKVGDPAPEFTLADLKGTKRVSLASFRGKKPVVLVFASYT